MKKKQAKQDVSQLSTTAAQIEYVDVTSLNAAEYNPRTLSTETLNAICRSIVEFGIVDPIIARREDRLIIGGHQRKVAIEHLLARKYKVKGKVVEWELPHGGVPVIFLDGVSDERAKLLNVALNKISGDWDYEALAELVGGMSTDGLGLEDLTVTGFTPAELTDFIDLAAEVGNDFSDGQMPEPTTKVPKLDLDFSTTMLRDAVKAKIAASAQGTELGGDTLATLLGVVV